MTALAYQPRATSTRDSGTFWTGTPNSTRMAGAIYAAFKGDYVAEFNDLLYQWKVETALLSSTMDMMQLPVFAKIVNMGDKIIPLIISDLRKQPSFIFLALHAITRENPVPASAQGRVKEIVNSWLAWAARNPRYAD